MRGSRLAGADGHLSRAAWSFGLSLGVAYQIQDDLLDLVGDQDVVGKSLGTDLDKGKLTLPLIRHLASASPQERSEALRLIEQSESATLRTRLIESGAVDYTRQTAARLIDEAREHLGLLPDSPVREVLEALAEAGLSRAY